MDARAGSDRAFEVYLGLTAQTYDVDFSGVVGHLALMRWVEELRLAMLTRHPRLRGPVDVGAVPVLVHTIVHYRRPVGVGDAVTARMWVSRAGHTRWALRAEFTAAGRVAATATQTGFFVDRATRRPMPLPADLRREVAGPQALAETRPDRSLERESAPAPRRRPRLASLTRFAEGPPAGELPGA
jgi:acyl-CoA thioester hydrolase